MGRLPSNPQHRYLLTLRPLHQPRLELAPATSSTSRRKIRPTHAWQLKAVDYKIAFSRDANKVTCTATAIADIHDMAM